MMQSYSRFIWITADGEDYYKNLSEKQKICLENRQLYLAQRQIEVSVIYNPDCGCPCDSFVLLDRFPMPGLIIASECPICKKFTNMKISDPILFHTEIWGDFTLDDLEDSIIMDTWQKYYLECYQNFHSFIKAQEKLEKKNGKRKVDSKSDKKTRSAT